MVLRPALSIALALLLAFPAWANPNVVGSVSSSQSATVRGANLTLSSTVFSGDTIDVGALGRAQIMLPGGAQVRVAENSQVRLTRMRGVTQLTIHRGSALFRTVDNSPVEALLADATIRSADGGPAVGMISVRGPHSAIIGAEKGTLRITTAHDSSSVTLREGDAAEVSVLPAKPKEAVQGGTSPAGSAGAGQVVIIAVIVGGITTAIALLLSHHEAQSTGKQKCDSVSPFRCP